MEKSTDDTDERSLSLGWTNPSCEAEALNSQKELKHSSPSINVQWAIYIDLLITGLYSKWKANFSPLIKHRVFIEAPLSLRGLLNSFQMHWNQWHQWWWWRVCIWPLSYWNSGLWYRHPSQWWVRVTAHTSALLLPKLNLQQDFGSNPTT